MKTKDKKEKKIGITPLADRVLIKEIKKEDKTTASGIIIPENVKDDRNTKRGVVVAIGKGKMEDGKIVPMNVEIGDKVLFSWGEELSIDGEEYFVVKDSEIIAIIK